MKMHVEHTFPCTPERFWQAFWDPEFENEQNAASGTQKTMLSDTTQGHVREWRVRVEPERELPGAIAALVGSSKLIYEQANRHDTKSGVLQWTVLPKVMADKVKAAGTLRVLPHRDGCQRIVDGDISVSVRFVGGKIEKAIVSDVEASYDRAAKALRSFLARNP